MQASQDFRDLLAALNAAEARYLVVGGYAMAFHALPRFTKDLDIWVEPTPDNARNVFGALAAFGAPVAGVRVEELATEGMIFQIGQAPLRVDILTSIEGVAFAEAWPNKVTATYGDQSVHMIGRAELRRNKLATGRARDAEDAELLGQE